MCRSPVKPGFESQAPFSDLGQGWGGRYSRTGSGIIGCRDGLGGLGPKEESAVPAQPGGGGFTSRLLSPGVGGQS